FTDAKMVKSSMGGSITETARRAPGRCGRPSMGVECRGDPAMTPKTFRKIALSFPETHEEPHFVRTSFRVGKKIFATMDPEGPEAMVRVRPPERLRALLEAHPDVFLSYGGWTERNAALGLRLAR